MENILWFPMAVAVGAFMVCLSHIFLHPLFQDSPEGSNCLRSGKIKNIFRPIAGFLITVLLVLIITSSGKFAIVAATLPPLLWGVLFVSLSRRRKKSQTLIVRELPLLLDYLVLQVESGHSIQQALRSASCLFSSDSPLHTGLHELDESMQIGCSLGQALDKFGLWLDTSEADISIAAISQATEHGTPLGKILREQSKRMRDYLILDGEQFANTVSVKILIPLLFFIFPASFLVIFSPVIVSLSGRLP